MHRVVVAAILAVGALASVSARAEELSAPGEPVLARMERPGGDAYEITVTPPADRGVDRRVMDWVTGTGATAESSEAEDADPLDMSGYRVRIERVAGAQCSASISLKSKPTSLAGHSAWYVESDTANSVSALAFPTKGEVDVYVLEGNSENLCDSSTKKKQNLDYAACTLGNCQTSRHYRAEVANPAASSATAIAAIRLVFVSLP